MNPTLDAYNIDDLRRMAKKRLPRGIFEYVDRGAEDEVALRHNTEIYRSLKIKNRVLKDVSARTTETEIFGRKLAMPFGISPTASAGLVSEGGEVGLARAAARMGVVCTAATSALTPMEEIHEAGDENLWFQLYMWTDMDLTARFVERIKAAGYETMLITVDGPVPSNREYNYRNGFAMPLRYSPRLIAQILANPGWCLRVLAPQYLKRGHFRKVNNPPELASKLTQIDVETSYTKPAAQNWDDVKRVRDMWPGNLLVKGLQSAEDAVIAADLGLQGVVLSNHGGRYLDSAPAPLEVVPEVRAAVGDRIKILIDSGARRGGDIVKAIALGADMVMSGRPTLYGSAVAGEAGSYRALDIFKSEMDRVMAQIGVNRIDELGPHIFWNPPDWVPVPSRN
ncbi:MAG: alpha-hydroxy acid oxidase [Rhodospirillaceae bacterium]|nr:alpha-hydroxy acid oxidase [Rhodospirillaceae bacterium]MDD9917928.1 alpha-hydroxy acid oxidase [Rhodospirillaceae bacterium]MDD9928357.1 alpha-hydroxy acid oxidase [Rhodospirillaceae bacterium]